MMEVEENDIYEAAPSSEWNLPDGTFVQDKEYGLGTLPCCAQTQPQGFPEPSWSCQFPPTQYPTSTCCFVEQGKSSQYAQEVEAAYASESPRKTDYRYMAYQPQFNPGYTQEPLIYPSTSSFGYCMETECLDKMCSPSGQRTYPSCLVEQPRDPVPPYQPLLNLPPSGDYTQELRVCESDEESDIIVEDSDTESEISIDVGPYISDKEVVKVAVMRCFVCNISYSEESQANFVQVNSSYPLTFISQTPVMLKLIEIIPIDMQTSVKFENNLICRRCLNLIDTVESLEVRLVSVKKAICDFVTRSGKEPEEELNVTHGSNDLCLNFEDCSSEGFDGCERHNLTSVGVNTEEIEGSEVNQKEVEKEKEAEREVVAVVEPVLPMRHYQCDRCGKMYKRDKDLREHLQKHEGKFKLNCSECGKGFMKSRYLELHQRRHRAHACSSCQASFTTSEDLTSHFSTCQGSKFLCTVKDCPMLFTTREKLDAHLGKHKKAPNACEICAKEFKTPSGLEAHKKSHSDNKPFSCDKCGLKYKNISHLNRHQKTHKTPFNCSICRSLFSSSEELQKHTLTHTEKFICDKCDKTFSSKSNLTEHSKIHSGTKTKKECPYCKKLISSNFKAHVQSHSEEKKFKCELCDADFTFKQSLAKHMKRRHAQVNSVT